jgi:tetratricopeptide (TPR) repeat protein
LLELSNHRSTDEPNVGTIILHRLGGSAAGTISLNSALVPKKASREYEKGVQFAEKGKFEEAEKHFEGATREYPKYAIAWFALGQLQQRDGSSAAAMKSFEAAIEADAKYASPYDQLALMSAQGQQWEAAAKYSSEAIALDSVDYPSCFWYNALANYHLKKTAEAEKSLAELLQKDKVHRYPQAENMFAQLLLEEGKYAEAAQHLREYLRLAPDAKDAGAAKELLTKLDKAQPPPSH